MGLCLSFKNSPSSLSKILSEPDTSILTERTHKTIKSRAINSLAFLNQHQNEEILDRINNIVKLFKELFPFLPEVPDIIAQFVDELSKDFNFISLVTIQNYSIIPFLCEILNSFTNEEIIGLTLDIIDYFLNLDFSMLVVLYQNEIFTFICNFFNIQSDQIHIKVANIFHSAILYDDLDDAFEQSIANLSKQIENGSESVEENDTVEDLQVSIFNNIINLFFYQSYIWSADIKNESLQEVCLDFEFIVIEIVYKFDQLFQPFSIDLIKTLCQLYLDIIQVGSERLKALAIYCSMKIMVGQKISIFEPSNIVQILLQMVHMEDSYLDKFIFHFLSALMALILSVAKKPISFLHESINFPFLCEKMVVSNDTSTIYFLCLFLNSFINNGSDSIDVLIKSNLLECYKQKLLHGCVFYCHVISGSIKDIFWLSTADQSLLVFQSGIIPALLQFLEDSLDETLSTVFNSICRAIQKCTEELGSEAFQSIQTIFYNESFDILNNLRESKYEEISQAADKIFEILEIG